jgi:hypothetical protein
LEDVLSPVGDGVHERGRVVERHHVGDDVLADRGALGAQQVDRLAREALAIPQMPEAARDAADLGAAHREAVVVELLASRSSCAPPW